MREVDDVFSEDLRGASVADKTQEAVGVMCQESNSQLVAASGRSARLRFFFLLLGLTTGQLKSPFTLFACSGVVSVSLQINSPLTSTFASRY